MTKQEFLRLLDDIDKASDQDIKKLEDILKQHSYFQTVPILQAKIASNIDADTKKKYVTRAAIYTADRANLKRIIEEKVVLVSPYIEEQENQPLMPVEKQQVNPAEIKETVEEIRNSGQPANSDILYKEVMKNLQTLKSLREKYEFLEEKVKENEEEELQEEKKTLIKSKKKEEPEVDHETTEGKLHKIDIEEQNSLIDMFIRKETQFTRKKPDVNIENKNDLSEKSTTITDEIVSENLAEIMLNQGKTEKAIDIYKKLIWKFPQKKAYFASRIEELNNK